MGALPVMYEEWSGQVAVRIFYPGDEADFRRLNVAWITRYFGLESKDMEVFDNPKAKIIAKGGQIFLAYLNGVAVGTVALMKMAEPRGYELAKMATDEGYQRRGIGRALMQAAIGWARRQCARRIYLETNSSLTPALKLYESSGFRYLPPQPTPYRRADVFMELMLEPE